MSVVPLREDELQQFVEVVALLLVLDHWQDLVLG